MVRRGVAQWGWKHHLKISGIRPARTSLGEDRYGTKAGPFCLKQAAVTQSLLWASWWQGCKNKIELTLWFCTGMARRKCLGYSLRGLFLVGGGGGGSLSPTQICHCDRLNNNIFCMFFTPECVFCNQDIQVSAGFWRIWSLSEIAVQIKAFCSD